jgi:predicted RNA methylase
MKKLKDLNKFYTHPDIAKIFVDKINSISPLNQYDLILEPAAGSGNILQFLPETTIGMDIEPENINIIKQDFFSYQPYDKLFGPYNTYNKIACITNPPFGKGYMNPLAKRFFNHAAEFSDLIAFIVPAKWHTSWKIQKQLNEKFGLYYSDILPPKSFLLDGKPYNVNCCMQIWSKEKLGINLKISERPKTSHEDFDLFLTCDNVSRRKIIREQLKENQYWEFGLKYWGKIHVCSMEDIPVDTTTHYLFKSFKPYVKDIVEQIDWEKYVTNMGAPNVGGKSIIIKAYTDKKTELGIL